jgi:hypothetical protein
MSSADQERILNDYYKLFGAVAILEVPDGVIAGIGDRYDSTEGFLPPKPPAETIVNDAI